MKVNYNIKKLREDRGMTLEELGKKISVSKQTIQRYETGAIKNIPYDKIELLSDALGVTETELMGWDDDLTIEIENETTARDAMVKRAIEYYKRLKPDQQEMAIEYLEYLVNKSKKDE